MKFPWFWSSTAYLVDSVENMIMDLSLLFIQDANFDKPSTQLLSVGAMAKNISFDTSQSCISQNISSSSLTEAQRCMSLYFALCTKVMLDCMLNLNVDVCPWSVIVLLSLVLQYVT